MLSELSNSAKKIQDFLSDKGYPFIVKELPNSTKTAFDAAESIGCDVAQIAKSLIFKDIINNTAILIIVSGKNRASMSKIEKQKGIKLIKADSKFVKEHTGFVIGGVPPVGHLEEMITFLDQDLLKYEIIWAAAGTPNAVFELKSIELEKLTDGEWLDLAE